MCHPDSYLHHHDLTEKGARAGECEGHDSARHLHINPDIVNVGCYMSVDGSAIEKDSAGFGRLFHHACACKSFALPVEGFKLMNCRLEGMAMGLPRLSVRSIRNVCAGHRH